MSRYIFDNAAQQAAQRFDSLETLYDRRTIGFLEATGVGQGWHCLEVGGGSGSIARWLSDRVGPTGRVLVTDIDTRHLDALAALGRPNLELQRHDVGVDPLPESAFDLIHERLVLIHVPARQQALGRLVAALKPGGWLVVEDFDPTFIDRTFATGDPGATDLYRKMLTAQWRLMAERGFEAGWGRNLYRRLRDHGLVEVGLEGHLAVRPGGSPGALLDRANFEQIRAEAARAGLITDEEVDRVLAFLDDPDSASSSPVMMSAWGRKP
jgi:ubiquinone/menaquinone biosynthesis C-methylase UbiE